VSYSLVSVLVSKRMAFFARLSAAVVGVSVGSLMIGMGGTLQFKVISAAMPDDFRRIPAISGGDDDMMWLLLLTRLFSLVFSIQTAENDTRRRIRRSLPDARAVNRHLYANSRMRILNSSNENERTYFDGALKIRNYYI